MRKIVVPSIALLLLFTATLAMAAPATKTAISGECTASATVPGETWITEGNIMHLKGGEGAGPGFGDLPGWFDFTMTGAINLNTGKGSMHGKFTLTTDHGALEGTWRTDNWDVVLLEGTAVAHGTGAYEGMLFKATFWGYNLYLGGYVGPDGIHFDYEGTILSPKGTPLPP